MSTFGRFITFEGGEGCGKSTQISLLSDHLHHQKIPHIVTREPGGTVGAEEIRTLILYGDEKKWDPWAEYLLFSAARQDHVTRKIRPALDQGLWVLCDRFYDSSSVYQGLRGVDEKWMDSVYQGLFGDFGPHITFLFDVPVDEVMVRLKNRPEKTDRFDGLDQYFHEKVRTRFLEKATLNPERWKILQGTGDPESILKNLLSHL
jgi:dTMP kinase